MTHALGRALTLTIDGKPQLYRVSGVLRDLPADTHLKFDLLVPLTPAFRAAHDAFKRWGGVEGFTYLRFRNAADAHAVQADLTNFVARRGSGDRETTLGPNASKILRLQLAALPTLHFKDVDVHGSFKPGVDSRVVASLAAVGVLTLLIAMLNYINLATARAALRAREVAIRKVLGATRGMLMTQFLAEAIAVALGSILLGLAMTELTLPIVNAVGGTSLKLIYFGKGGVGPLLMALALVVGVGAGLYPAVLLSRFRPAGVLAASRLPGGGRVDGAVRAALVTIQFAVAIAFAICTFVMSAQASFMQTADRGFRREGLILIDSLMTDSLNPRQGAIVDALRSVAGVRSVALSDREPAAPNQAIWSVSRPGMGEEKSDLVRETIGPGYFDTYGAKVIAGRPFDSAHGADDLDGQSVEPRKAGSVSVMINEAALKPLGFASAGAAVGQTLRAGSQSHTIIGVVRNIRFMSARQPIAPMFYFYDARLVDEGAAAVRYDGVDAATMTARLAAAWRKVAPEIPFVSKTADARLADYYVPDEQRARLFTIGAILAVAIGCLGLYGLASFSTARRVKEIGIRKTLGASTTDILRLLIGQFLRPVLIANLIAWPLAWLAMRSWLSGFDQRIALSPLYFVAATLLTLLIAVGTVAGQAFAVARAEPAKALRHE
jgi:putative ABC transport system permease protein